MVDGPHDLGGESRTAPTASQPPGGAGQAVRAGQVLGDRYEIRSRLGAGGMGEVWLATDLRLRIDVALKSVRPDYLTNERLRDLLRREVLAAREVQSPNVCRVFDLQVTEDMELVSMEYVAGRTLAEFLKERTPLPLREARDIAAQFLAGLEAVHDAGLVHRDFKPENVMITPVGRVVVMDLGLAARPELMDGGAAGTPAYMPPEQSRGGSVDARADVFAAGVVLAEMIAPAGIRDREKRITLWEGLRSDPPRIPEGPWTPVIRKALSREPGDRFGSARELSRELDGLTLRVEEGESIEPYPGLAAFTEENAERFFGREAEIEALLRKLGRARLLAIAGPSGAGKTSFVQAGLIPALAEDWGHLVVHPGERPFGNLARGLESRSGARCAHAPRPPDSASAEEEARLLTALRDAVRQWREGFDQAVLVFDQFEELFTLNAPDIQQRFAEFLGTLPLEADVHVLLSMRDDFFFRCQEHEALAPAFAEVTPLGHPTGAALRRALVQPALSCGYRFEDEALVEAMLGQVEHQRGALPLLAFAARRVWEKRDREEGTLTRSAYEQIGGVGGALAHHAEETLQRIGPDRVPVVRELFRNLVTAESTRAARDREELLSVFESSEDVTREAAAEVLDALIDARLLTSYETREAAGPSEERATGTVSTVPVSTSSGGGATVLRRRIEIIHESLLAAWPRLVRWQVQDADAAQLRDQLRQAADAWKERDRSKDLLWTGSAYREFALWRERYPGGLSATEEAFARAMRQHADRTRQIRRVAGVAVVAVLTSVAIVLAVLWRQSELARSQAEAAHLLSLGQMRLDSHPMGGLAHAIASLERADSEAARRLALEALWKGPPAFVIRDAVHPRDADWSPDGRYLAIGGQSGLVLLDGDSGERYQGGDGRTRVSGFSADGTRLVALTNNEIQVRTVPGLELVRSWPEPAGIGGARLFDRRLVAYPYEAIGANQLLIREDSIDTGPGRVLGALPRNSSIDGRGDWLALVKDGQLVKWRLEALDAPPQVIAAHDVRANVTWYPWTDRLVTSEVRRGTLTIWDAETGRRLRHMKGPVSPPAVALEPSGRYLLTWKGGNLASLSAHLFDLEEPVAAEPAPLLNDDVDEVRGRGFHPTQPWLATAHGYEVLLWNLASRRSRVLRSAMLAPISVAFAADGQLLSASEDGHVRLWPLWKKPGADVRFLRSPQERNDSLGESLPVSPGGRFAVGVVGAAGQVQVLPLDGSEAVVHEVFESPEEMDFGRIAGAKLAPDGRRLALSYFAHGRPDDASIRVLDLETGEVQKLFPEAGGKVCVVATPGLGLAQSPLWLPDGRLASDGATGLRLWDLESGLSQPLRGCRDMDYSKLAASADSNTIVTLSVDKSEPVESRFILQAFDLASRTTRRIGDHGNQVTCLALDPTGTILVTGSEDGLVRVGPLAGGEPHLLFGHQDEVWSLAVSPDGKWVASASHDETIRLWPMPDLAEPPLHALELGDLVEKLGSLTNLRVVSDPGSSSGYELEPGPFPGWKTVPAW